MNKKQKMYIGILVVLVIVFLITKMGNNVEKRINFFQVDSTKIKTIEISNIKDTLRLSKENEIWKIVYPFENDTNEYQINSIFSKVLNVKTSNLPISENENSFDTYKVTNSQGTWIKFIDENDKVLDEAIIGKSSSSKTTPARRPDVNKITGEKKLSWRLKRITFPKYQLLVIYMRTNCLLLILSGIIPIARTH